MPPKWPHDHERKHRQAALRGWAHRARHVAPPSEPAPARDSLPSITIGERTAIANSSRYQYVVWREAQRGRLILQRYDKRHPDQTPETSFHRDSESVEAAIDAPHGPWHGTAYAS